MAFNIQEFQSQLSSGLGEKNSFIVDITAPVFPDVPLRFYCQSVGLPAFDIQTSDVAIQGFGAPNKKPVNMQYPIVPATFMIDSGYSILKFFHRWQQSVINYDRTSTFGVGGQLPFQIGYKSEYAGTMTIACLPKGGGGSYVYEFGGVFPIQVGSVDMAWSEEGFMQLAVGFAFDVIRVSGARAPDAFGDRSGANSLLTYFSQANTYIQAFKTLNRPNEVQNLINQTANILNGL